jgi:hypothetical protein
MWKIRRHDVVIEPAIFREAAARERERRKHADFQKLPPTTDGLQTLFAKLWLPSAMLLNRYAAQVGRMLTAYMHELERLQRRRGGEPVAPPLAIDHTIDGESSVGLGNPAGDLSEGGSNRES